MSAIGRRTGRVLTSQVELTFLDWVESRLGLCQELGRKLHRRRPPIVAVTVTVKIVHELKARRWRLFFVSNSSRPSVALPPLELDVHHEAHPPKPESVRPWPSNTAIFD